MSAVPNQNSIGSSISGDVLGQIKAREAFVSSKTKSIEWHRVMTSRSAWAKLSSGVNYSDSSSLAKAFELSATGNIGSSDINPAYDNDANTLGFRAVPGINSLQVKHLNRFGTLREAVVTFRAFTVDQLDVLEQLYMRPGMSVLLEWGHSVGIDNNGERISQIETYGDRFYNEGQTKQGILNELARLRTVNAHNYEAMYGFIRNFSWSFNQDGSYNCTVTVVSIGVILEDLFLTLPTKSLKSNEVKEGEDEKKKSPIHNILLTVHELFGSNEDAEAAFSTLALSEGLKASLTTNSFASFEVNRAGKDGAVDISRVSYIKFEALVKILDYLFSFTTNKGTETISRLTLDPFGRFNTYSNHFSGNPGVVLIGNIPSGDEIDNNIGLRSPVYGKITEELQAMTTANSSIGELWVNVEHIIELTDRVTTDTGIRLLELINALCSSINKALGHITELDVAYEESLDEYFIVDRKIIKKATQSEKEWPVELGVTGLTSTVHNISLQSKISPEISTMVAITAQNSETITNVGLEAENLFRWNQNLSDRIMSQRTQRGEFEAGDNSSSGVKIYIEAVRTVTEVLQEFKDTNVFDTSKFDSVHSAHRTITQEGFRRYRKDKTDPSPGIIPFELTITLDGIGGLKIGQTFRLGGPILPRKYREEIGFIITGVDQSIESNYWKTSLRAQTIKV